jgi:hypothetical protein
MMSYSSVPSLDEMKPHFKKHFVIVLSSTLSYPFEIQYAASKMLMSFKMSFLLFPG